MRRNLRVILLVSTIGQKSLSAIQLATGLMRYFGPKWIALRALHIVKQRSGWFSLRHPARQWTDVPSPTKPDWARQWRDRFLPAKRGPRGMSIRFDQWDRSSIGPSTEAESILAGTLRLFGHLECGVGTSPDWLKNPLTGERAPREVHWSRLSEFAYGDIKSIWELSRFAFVFPLARAYARTGDERLAERFWQLVESWATANPPSLGPNWKCGQETAIRVIALSFGVAVFLDSPASTVGRLKLLGRIFAESARRIEANLPYALNQDNNHGLSELAGLITVALILSEPEEAAMRVKRWAQLFEREVLRLVAADGAFSQYSTNYHRMMLHLAAWCGRLVDVAGCPFRSEVRERIRSAAAMAARMMDWNTGNVPCYGSNDGANILPLTNADYPDHRPAVQLAFLWSHGERMLPPGPWDEASWWLLGDAALEKPEATPGSGDLAVASCGYFTITGGDTTVFARCGAHQFRPHHADQLHLEIRHRGAVVAADAGTFSYNAPPPLNHAFASTAFHNTLSVDGQDQMDRVGRFLWLPWSRGRLLANLTNPDGSRFWVGSFTWRGGVRHQRAVHVDSSGDVTVLDVLDADDSHQYALHWLLADLPAEAAGSPQVFDFRLQDDSRWVLTVGCSESRFESDRVRADVTGSGGWMSRYYQRLEPAWSWRVGCAGKRAAFVTRFAASKAEIRFGRDRVEVDGSRFDWSDEDAQITLAAGERVAA